MMHNRVASDAEPVVDADLGDPVYLRKHWRHETYEG